MANFSNKEVREIAKRNYVPNLGIGILAIISVSLITGVASATGFGAIAVVVLAGLLDCMIASLFLAIARGKKAEFKDITNGAKNLTGAIIYGLLQTVFIFLWSLLLIIPGIIKGYSYSQAKYLIADEKEQDGNAAITSSRKLMYGYKWQLFCLHFSFIPRYLLGIITLGIYFIWALPYFETANAAFHTKLMDETTVEVVE